MRLVAVSEGPLEAGVVPDDKAQPVYEVKPLERPRSYMYTVFNAEQANGLPPRPLPEAGHQWEQNERVEKLIKNCGVALEHATQDRVFYDMGRDVIVLPHREQFPTPTAYYQSALHELGRWTGHPDRLNRESLLEGIRQGPKSVEYTREEMWAEISSMITADRLGLGHDGSRTASYVGYWGETLKDHPQEIYLASRDTQGMSDYLMDRGKMIEHSREASVQDRQGRETIGQQEGLVSDRNTGREHLGIEIPRQRQLTLPWPDRDRAMGPTR